MNEPSNILQADKQLAENQLSLPVVSSRLLSLDVFRGITVAAMILVNNPGSWANIYPPLRHAEWHGCYSHRPSYFLSSCLL
jgi:predicted acyltransferase